MHFFFYKWNENCENVTAFVLTSVTAMLTDLGLATLEKRREDQKLLLMYKVVHRLVGVSCEELGLEKADKRTRASHCHKLRHHQPTTTEYRHSFICSTIPEWNRLPANSSFSQIPRYLAASGSQRLNPEHAFHRGPACDTGTLGWFD